jgi:phage repressor protein C with HTH and peptisase S24 domain
MNKHQRVWNATDLIAERQDTSPSGLAKRIGMDATAFNPSKRIQRDGRQQWPSTETIQKILDHAGLTWLQWGTLVEGGDRAMTGE